MRARPLLTGAATLVLAASAIGCGEPGERMMSGEPVPSRACLIGSEDGQFQTGPSQRGPDLTGDRHRHPWYVHVPTVYDGENPMPVVFELHDYGQDASTMSAISGFPELGEQEGFVTVALEGPRGTQRWLFDLDSGWEFHRRGSPDSEYFGMILEYLGRELCLDLTRTYVTGLGNGGWAAAMLACEDPWKIAAIAPVAGLVDFNDYFVEAWDDRGTCAERGRIPILAFHGTEDPHLLLEGGVGSSSPIADHPVAAEAELLVPIIERAADIARHYGCSEEPTSEALTSGVERLSYDCPEGADVELVLVEGAGHTWPGSSVAAADEARLGPTNMDIDATRMIWEFFSEHPKPALGWPEYCSEITPWNQEICEQWR